MLNNITIGRYYPINSIIHNMHPLAKIICVILFVVAAFLSSLYVSLILFLIMILFLMLTNIPLKNYFKVLKSLRTIIICLIIVNLICQIPIEESINILIRLIIIVLYTTMFTITTTPNDITYGLNLFLSPLRAIGIPVGELSLSISLALRFIPSVIDQANKILKSQASRGIDYYNSKLKNKMLIIKSMLFPMFNLSFKKADNLAESMELRLYDINKTRSSYRTNKWHIFDSVFIIVHILIIVVEVII